MQLFLDTADIGQIAQRSSAGLITGVTTNPTLIKKSGRKPEDVYQSLVDIGIQDISMEVVGNSSTSLVRQGSDLVSTFGPVSTIKLPCSTDGLKACKRLTEMGIRVNMTLVFSVSQAILCSLAGATYVSPFIGRMDDNSLSGLDLIGDIARLFKLKQVETKVLAASVRDVQSVSKAFEYGADICTVPVDVYDKMGIHVLTAAGIDKFNSDWNETMGKTGSQSRKSKD